MKHKSRHRKQRTTRITTQAAATYKIDAITHDARGIARVNGKVIFIAGALPNEVVQAQVIKSNRRYDEAVLTSITTPSEFRVEPACQHYGHCGGCSFQHLAYEQQLEAKLLWLKGQLRNCYSGDIELLQGDDFQYRRRARLSVKLDKQANIAFGFRAKGSADIINIHSCLVLTKPLQALLPVLQATLKRLAKPQVIGHIELLEDTLGCSVLLRLTGTLTATDKDHWLAATKAHNAALYWQDKNGQVFTDEQNITRQYQLNELVMSYHPQAFIQVNQTMNERMVAQALDWLELTEDDKVLDLFCGVGNFSLPMATRAATVVGVEVQAEMVTNAQNNANRNHLHNVTFIGADLTQPITHEKLAIGFTKVLLDPPRAGAMEFLPSLIKLKPKTILYVSCDAATLARDAGILVAEGYNVKRVSMMEMFPQTSHVETMMLLQK